MSNSFEKLKARDQKAICSTYGRYPLAVAKARGSRMWDLDGKEYVDLLAGIAVTALGHCPPEITRVIAEQADKLVHVSNLFYQREQVELAEKLLDTCAMDRVYFCNSGAEANESAIKLARRYMRRVKTREAYEIITLSGSFHGRSLATLTATGQDFVKDGFGPLPDGFTTVPFGDVTALEAAITDKTAAIMVEMVQGEGGIHPLPLDYVVELARIRRENDILLIADEIQTGMCRTGRFWAHQHYAEAGFAPDVFTVAKPLANGLPMGAMLATAEAARGFEPGSHATTFGGSALVSAVGCAVVDAMVQGNLADRARETGQYAMELFNGLRKRHPKAVTEVRGMGLMLGIELSGNGQEVWEALLEAGFVVNLSHGRILRLLPALTIERKDLEDFAQALDGILDKL